MATLTLSITPANPNPGQTVTATYSWAGADTTDHLVTFPGGATLDGVAYTASGSLTLTHVKGYTAPGPVAGWTWTQTANPAVWTAVAPSA